MSVREGETRGRPARISTPSALRTAALRVPSRTGLSNVTRTSRGAAAAEHRLLPLVGVAARPNRRQLTLESRALNVRAAGEPDEIAAQQLPDAVAVEVCEHGFSERRRVQRQHRADFEDLERRIGAKDGVADEHAVLVRDADPDGFLGSLREPLRPDERASAKLTQVEVLARELQPL